MIGFHEWPSKRERKSRIDGDVLSPGSHRLNPELDQLGLRTCLSWINLIRITLLTFFYNKHQEKKKVNEPDIINWPHLSLKNRKIILAKSSSGQTWLKKPKRNKLEEATALLHFPKMLSLSFFQFD